MVFPYPVKNPIYIFQLILGHLGHFLEEEKAKLFFTLQSSTVSIPRPAKDKKRKRIGRKRERLTFFVQTRLPQDIIISMGSLQALVLFSILLQTCKTTAVVKEWKSATATYTKETNGSIIIEGACGYGDLHKASYGKYSAGLSTMLFTRGSACGACFEIRCVDHILYCRVGSPSVVLTATDFCPPNNGLSVDYGGWCNFPKEHFEMSEAAFAEIAERRADIVPVQYKRVKCLRSGGVRFTMSGSSHFYQVLVTNVGMDGEVIALKVKGSRTGWIPMARNWGQIWQCSVNLRGQPLSFEVTTSSRRTLTSYNVAPANWEFGQTYEGKQF